MDDRQVQLETLVVSYYRSKAGTHIVSEKDGTHMLRLDFRHAAVPFAGSKDVCLTFDGDLKFYGHNRELVDAGHPCLEYIRNDLLAQDDTDPRLTEAHVRPQLACGKPGATVPGVRICGHIEAADQHTSFSPVFVFTYNVTLNETDYRIRVCLDAVTRAPRTDVVIHFPRLAFHTGSPAGVDVTRPELREDHLQEARALIQDIVLAETDRLVRESRTSLVHEVGREDQHLKQQLASIPEFKTLDRENAQKGHARRVGDVKQRYEVRSKAGLASVMLLWLPSIRYSLHAKGKTKTVDVPDFTYDVASDSTAGHPCQSCESTNAVAICEVGHHAVCGNIDCCVELSCDACGFRFCKTHGAKCGCCEIGVCVDDSDKCLYGNHDVEFCPECLKPSYDDRQICPSCATTCDTCGRLFPEDLVKTCRLGGETICVGHDNSPDGGECSESGENVCLQTHGVITEDGVLACIDHVATTTCCKKTFGKSKVRPCADDNSELLCETHKKICCVCSKWVCPDHVKYTENGQPLCSACKRSCVQCVPTIVHRRDHVRVCAVCDKDVCVEHRTDCLLCGCNAFCSDHEHELKTCESCALPSCGGEQCTPSAAACEECGQRYCQRCVPQGKVCSTCQALANVAPDSTIERVLDQIVHVSNRSLAKSAEYALKTLQSSRVRAARNQKYTVERLLGQFVQVPNKSLAKSAEYALNAIQSCSVRAAINQTYVVYAIEFRPAWYRRLFGHRSVNMRAVVRRSDGVLERVLPVAGQGK